MNSQAQQQSTTTNNTTTQKAKKRGGGSSKKQQVEEEQEESAERHSPSAAQLPLGAAVDLLVAFDALADASLYDKVGNYITFSVSDSQFILDWFVFVCTGTTRHFQGCVRTCGELSASAAG